MRLLRRKTRKLEVCGKVRETERESLLSSFVVDSNPSRGEY
jgi:hypothetical protein